MTRHAIEREAKCLWTAYSVAVRGHSVVTGDKLPEWSECIPSVREAWMAVAEDVLKRHPA